MSSTKNNFADIDSLMDAAMDDLEDLPPVGVPPTGHYNLCVSAERKQSTKDGGGEYFQFSYVVEAINEVKDGLEEAQAAVGQKFSQMFSPLKKDGTVNEWGVGFLKEAVAPFSAHFGTPKMGETILAIQNVTIAASLVRTVDKKDAERFNFKLKDVVVL
jgi:hypothetical protein